MELTSWTARKRIWKFTGLVVADGVVFSLTNARDVPSFMLAVGFLLLAVTFYYLAYSLLAFARLYGLPVKRKRRLAGAATGMVAGLVALQSIGELNPRDVLVLLPLVVVGYAYGFYSRAGAKAADAPG